MVSDGEQKLCKSATLYSMLCNMPRWRFYLNWTSL